jgi:mono/diheme cytochrome c family protein
MTIPKSVFWILLSISIAAAAYGTILIRRGFSTNDQPSTLETELARAARSQAIPASAKREINPYTSTPENVREGREHFASDCAICHADLGNGLTEIGRNLYPPPPDMRLAGTQDLTDGELYYIISNGVRMSGMPGWGESRRNEDIWKLVLFIRRLPQLSVEEEKDMDRFNPKRQVTTRDGNNILTSDCK